VFRLVSLPLQQAQVLSWPIQAVLHCSLVARILGAEVLRVGEWFAVFAVRAEGAGEVEYVFVDRAL
jgi:hypothetical protein